MQFVYISSVPEMTYNVFSGTLNPTHSTLPYLLNICRKFELLIFQGNVATCLR